MVANKSDTRRIPDEGAAAIQMHTKEAQRAISVAQAIVDAVLQTMGCDITPRPDGMVWNVLPNEKGDKLFAKLGPRLPPGVKLGKDGSIIRAVALNREQRRLQMVNRGPKRKKRH